MAKADSSTSSRFDEEKIAQAFRRSAKRMRLVHTALGLPIVGDRDGHVAYFDPTTMEEIPADQVASFLELAKRRLDD